MIGTARRRRNASLETNGYDLQGVESGAEQDDFLRVLQAAEQLGDGGAELRVRDVGGELRERQEYEAPLLHLGVRQLQVALVDRLIVEEEEVEVDDPRPPA